MDTIVRPAMNNRGSLKKKEEWNAIHNVFEVNVGLSQGYIYISSIRNCDLCCYA